MVIQNADLSIIAEDPAQSMDEIGKMAESMGGFIVESHLYQQTLSSGAQVPHATITIRVPVEKLEDALSQIKAGAVEVESANISGQDVTSQYTDLASRLRNLEAAEAQLQEIMDDANRTEDVLDVFNELVAVREQIEVIKGQMKYYEESAALSMISVGITADEAVQPLQLGGWQPAGVAKEAIEALIQTLQFLANAGIWFVLCVLPIGLLIGLPLFFIIRAVARRRRKRKVEKPVDKVIPEE
jgi:cysteinyl-tRNA synthetase